MRRPHKCNQRIDAVQRSSQQLIKGRVRNVVLSRHPSNTGLPSSCMKRFTLANTNSQGLSSREAPILDAITYNHQLLLQFCGPVEGMNARVSLIAATREAGESMDWLASGEVQQISRHLHLLFFLVLVSFLTFLSEKRRKRALAASKLHPRTITWLTSSGSSKAVDSCCCCQ